MEFLVAATLLSWIAIFLLAVIVAALLRATATASAAAGPRWLDGERVADIEGPIVPFPTAIRGVPVGRDVTTLVVTSDGCPVCSGVEAFLRKTRPSSIGWLQITDEPSTVAFDVVKIGGQVCPILLSRAEAASIGARGAPFIVVGSPQGLVVRSGPITNIDVVMKAAEAESHATHVDPGGQ